MKVESEKSFLRKLVIAIASAAFCFVIINKTTAAQSTSDANEFFKQVLDIKQGWGQTGYNTAAHKLGNPQPPLKVKDQVFSAGLGSHAPGEIIVDLNGQYAAFEAKIGVQQQNSKGGSVIFKVYVDGKKVFESGIIKQADAAQPVKIPVLGASELRLIMADAGDGMNNDLADWIEPHLIKDPNAKPRQHAKHNSAMDVAPFARIITGDPNRTSGCAAKRVQEFRSEDVFLEKDICPEANGIYKIAPSDKAMAYIGLRWLENRKPAQLAIEFADNSIMPSSANTKLQIWEGESPWQGKWRVAECNITKQGNKFECALSAPQLKDFKTRKIRWVFSQLSNPVSVKCLSASIRMNFVEQDISIAFEKGFPKGKAALELYNAEFLTDSQPKTTCTIDTAKECRLKVRIGTPQIDSPSGALLRLRAKDEIVTVSLDDLQANGCIYAPQHHLYVTADPNSVDLKEYKKQIADKKTVLERVRAMPDQTFAQAMAKTHNPIQDKGPMMLSLACDNFKFVANSDASIMFSPFADTSKKGLASLYPAGMKTRELPQKIKTQFGPTNNLPTKRHLEGGWLPIHVVTASSGQITYTQRTYVAPFDSSGDSRDWPYICDKPICVAEYIIENNGDAESDAEISMHFSDLLKDALPIQLSKDKSLIAAHQKDRIMALIDLADSTSTKEDTNTVTITWKLPPKAVAKCFVSIPTWDVNVKDAGTLAVKDTLRNRVKAHWDKVLAGTMQVDIPDQLLSNTIRASQVHCLIAARNEEDGKRISAYVSADRYGALESESHSVIRGMDFFGNDKFAQKSLDYFLARYNPDGFVTTGYTLIGTGWHLWSVGEHFELTDDAAWLRSHEAAFTKVCQWIIKQRHKTEALNCKGQKVLEYGLVPPGVIADWNVFAYHYCLSAYYYAGLKAAADALAVVNSPGASDLQKDAASFKSDILESYSKMQKLSPVYRLQNGTSVTGYPSQAYLCGPVNIFFPGEDGNRSWCYDVELGASQLVPTGIIDPTAPQVTDMLNHMEDVQFLSNGWFDYPAEKSKADWFDLGGFAKVQPYYCRNAEIYAMQDDVKPFIRSYFNSIAALLSAENLSIWEHFNNHGGWNKTHETGYFLHQSRTMLLTEHGSDLCLAPFVTNNWLKDGMSIKVKDAPTLFGKISYEIDSHVKAGYITAVIEPPTRKAPKQIVLRFRHPDGKQFKKVMVNGKRYTDFDSAKECIYLKPGTEKITIRAEY